MLIALLLTAMTTTAPTTQPTVLLHENFKNLDRWHLEGRTDGVSVAGGGMRLACAVSGKVGFRAIGSKAIFRIANLKVTALPSERKADAISDRSATRG